jgi:DNA-binding protein
MAVTLILGDVVEIVQGRLASVHHVQLKQVCTGSQDVEYAAGEIGAADDEYVFSHGNYSPL